MVPQIKLQKVEVRLLSCQRKGKWEEQEVINSHRHLGISRGLRKKPLNLFVPDRLTPADLSLVLWLLQIFDKQSLFFNILPLSP